MPKLPPTVYLLAWVSFFNDVASDMVIPLLPLLLAGPIGGGAIALGLMEGAADAVASLMRVWSGRRSDRSAGGRKPLAVAGYTLSNVVRPLLGLAPAWWSLLALRAIDRVGKGIRSAPRDALLVDVTPVEQRGQAFGIHRAFDNAGAVCGALLAALLLHTFHADVREVVWWSAVPGSCAVLLFAFAVREPARRHAPPPASPPPSAPPPSPLPASPPTSLPAVPNSALPTEPHADRRLTPGRLAVPPGPVARRFGFLAAQPALARYLRALILFSASRSSETFIVLRGHELDMSPGALLVLWAGLNAAKAGAARLGGARSDRHGPLTILRVSWLGSALTSAALAVAGSPAWLAAVALVGSVPVGLGEGAERAYIGDLAPFDQRGTAYGWYNLTTGMAAIPAGLAFGTLWHYAGAPAAFLTAALIGLAALAWLPATAAEA